MDPLAVVEELDVVKQVGFDLAQVPVMTPMDPLLLQLREEALDAGVVVRTARGRHAAAIGNISVL